MKANTQRLRRILAGSAGNLVEWYDWFAYASFSLYFAPIFFPEGDQTAQLLHAAAVFAIGFLARPIGAWLMGVYADRAGRRAAMMLAVSMMCLGSLLIAATPGFAAIGIASPAMLLLARILQGLSVGGEYGASATYLSEVAGKAKRGFWSSFHYVTLVLGQLLALAVLVILQQTIGGTALEDWGWRIPFIIGAALAVVVFWARANLDETDSFENSKKVEQKGSRTLHLLRRHPREVLMIVGLTAGGSLSFYSYTTYMQKFLVNTAGFSKSSATGIMALALVVFMILQPAMGLLSDFVGRRRLLILAFGGGALFSYPILSSISHAGSTYQVFALLMCALVFQSGYTSISAVVKAELFPAHVRALGVALPYALANAVFGGTAEYMALWFKNIGLETGFYVYVSVMLGISCLVAICMRDTKLKSEIIED